MSKRVICFVDSHSTEGLYSYLCVNFPVTLRDEFNTINLNDLSAFELFYFAHKDEVEIKSFFVDKTFVAFVAFFSSLFECKDSKSLSILNDVLDSIYNSSTSTQVYSILREKNTESIAIYIGQIRKELSFRDDEGVAWLITKANNLLNSLIESHEQVKYNDFCDELLLRSLYADVDNLIEGWIADGNEYEFLGSFEHACDTLCEDKWVSDALEVNILKFTLESMTRILEGSIHSYDEFTDEMKSNLFDLWILLVTTGYKVVLPSKFYENLKRIIPH